MYSKRIVVILAVLLFHFAFVPLGNVLAQSPAPFEFSDTTAMTLDWKEGAEFILLNNTVRDITVEIRISEMKLELDEGKEIDTNLGTLQQQLLPGFSDGKTLTIPANQDILVKIELDSKVKANLKAGDYTGYVHVFSTDPEYVAHRAIELSVPAVVKGIDAILEQDWGFFANNVGVLKPSQVIFWGLIIASLVLFIVVIRLFTSYNLNFTDFFRLRMGLAEYNVTESWASTLVLGVAILEKLGDIIPEDSSVISSEGFTRLTMMFAAITLAAGFVYNAFTRVSKEEDTKEGHVWAFLVAGLLTAWALFGQLGTQIILLESLRNDSERVLPPLILTLFEGLLLLLIIIGIWYALSRLWGEIEKQDLDAQKHLLPVWNKQRKALKNIIQAIDHTRNQFRKISISNIDDSINLLKANLVNAVNEFDEFSELTKLFEELPEQFRFPDPSGDERLRLSRDLLKRMKWDAQAALDLLNRDPARFDNVDELITVFFSTLGVPAKIRRKTRLDTLVKIWGKIEIAKAQISDPIELDKVVTGEDQYLVPGIKASLDEGWQSLGQLSETDKIEDKLLTGLEEILIIQGQMKFLGYSRIELQNKLKFVQMAIYSAWEKLKKNPETEIDNLLKNLRDVMETSQDIWKAQNTDVLLRSFSEVNAEAARELFKDLGKRVEENRELTTALYEIQRAKQTMKPIRLKNASLL